MRAPLKRILVSAVAILAISLAGAPLFVDETTARDTLVEQLSTALGRPVTVEKLTIKLLPHPAVILNNVRAELGDQPEEHIEIGRIQIALATYELFRGRISIRRLEVSKTVLTKERITRLRQLFAGTPDVHGQSSLPLPLHLSRAQIEDITWEPEEGKSVGPFSATVRWTNSPRPDSIDIVLEDHRFEMHLQPREDRIDFRVRAHNLDPYFNGPISLARMDARGSYRNSRLSIDDATVQAFDGVLKLAGELSWSDGWVLQANLASDNTDFAAMLRVAELTPIPGRIGGRCAVTSSAELPELLVERSLLNCGLTYRHNQQDASIALETQAGESAQRLYEITVHNFTLPLGPRLHADSLKAKGEFDRKHLKIASAEIEGYQGRLLGSGELAWAAGWRFDFDARGHHLLIEPILSVFGKRSMNGSLTGDCRGSLSGRQFSRLAEQPRLDCNYVITDGILYNADLERAASLTQNAQWITGSTPFDRLSGQLRMAGGITRLERLAMQSTALEAGGDITVDATGALAGDLSVGLMHTNKIVSMPLVVSGTTQDPSLRPTKSALAGGAAGTVLLGPGVGTALGIKVGETLNKLNNWLNPGKRSEPTPSQIRE